MSWDDRCSRCGDDLEDDRDERICEDCDRALEHRAHVEGVHCPKCDGWGESIDCFDDLCHANGECLHSGNTVCSLCGGGGRVSLETRGEYYEQRLAKRAQLTPIGIGVLTVAVGLLLAGAIVIGVVAI
ncbi:hypothetical protein [Natronorubrum halophilum]|uniref:hypothetical protein n=1 Tax=Natronorubrum halophilum TaxID=1702106 RepID=UPI001EE8F867|nr:hypothetical protein [Natronorubrum halophilum]